MKAIVNKKARHNYEVLERLEVGIVLTGAEVKSVKSGQIVLGEGFVQVHNGELLLENVEIPKYRYSSQEDYEPRRTRKLLAKKREIERLDGKSKQGGLTIVPLRVYTSHGLVKLEVGLCRGRKRYEKKDREKKRDMDREFHRQKRALGVS
ncbi:SsrA-binding protein SmpB [Candidatus Dojkabacteria bacterium]|nr:SsrA-binding protein SmpB [Candidatus Dojkabacteria bacterium]